MVARVAGAPKVPDIPGISGPPQVFGKGVDVEEVPGRPLGTRKVEYALVTICQSVGLRLGEPVVFRPHYVVSDVSSRRPRAATSKRAGMPARNVFR